MKAAELKDAIKTMAFVKVEQAEDCLLQAIGLIEKAQASISVIGTGLNQNWSKLGNLREKLKTQMYDLQHCRETGLCGLDETSANMLLKKKAKKR